MRELVSEWVREWVHAWVREGGREWISELVQWVSEWVGVSDELTLPEDLIPFTTHKYSSNHATNKAIARFKFNSGVDVIVPACFKAVRWKKYDVGLVKEHSAGTLFVAFVLVIYKIHIVMTKYILPLADGHYTRWSSLLILFRERGKGGEEREEPAGRLLRINSFVPSISLDTDVLSSLVVF